MSSFTGHLTVRSVGDRTWSLTEEFHYYRTRSEGTQNRFTVPRGFKTDFASVPRAFWPIVPPTGRHSKAAVLHDYLYSGKSRRLKKRPSRREADEIFLESMRVLGVARWRALLMWAAVRVFGGGKFVR